MHEIPLLAGFVFGRYNGLTMREDFKRGIDQTYPDEMERNRNADGLVLGHGPWDSCPRCEANRWVRIGYDRHGLARWRCMFCRKSIFGNQYRTGEFYQEKPLGIVKLPVVRKVPRVIELLCTGKYSVREAASKTKLHRDTVCKILRNLEDWLSGREDLQAELGISIPVRCQCGQPLRKHVSMCDARRAKCRPRYLDSPRLAA